MKINQTSTVKDIGPACVQKSQQVVVLSPKFSGGNIQVLFIRITFQYELNLYWSVFIPHPDQENPDCACFLVSDWLAGYEICTVEEGQI